MPLLLAPGLLPQPLGWPLAVMDLLQQGVQHAPRQGVAEDATRQAAVERLDGGADGTIGGHAYARGKVNLQRHNGLPQGPFQPDELLCKEADLDGV
eukprot:4583239-Lingulodinium_polyedra.AAC.1